jgi:hypothetical protein
VFSALGPDIIPRLHDAKVYGMAQLRMNVSGVGRGPWKGGTAVQNAAEASRFYWAKLGQTRQCIFRQCRLIGRCWRGMWSISYATAALLEGGKLAENRFQNSNGDPCRVRAAGEQISFRFGTDFLVQAA